jgi:hypothetical protein
MDDRSQRIQSNIFLDFFDFANANIFENKIESDSGYNSSMPEKTFSAIFNPRHHRFRF